MAADPTARIFLTGFSGTGKSSVARLAAQALGVPAVDTDTLIEAGAGRSIAEIFASDGEPAFRALETDALRRAAAGDAAVIATGGGAVIAAENRRLMAGAGLVVGLDASPETIVRRLSEGANGSERPLLAGDNPLARVRELRARRARFYALADAHIDTDGRSAGDVAREIAALARAGDAWAACHTDRMLLPEERERAAPDAPVWVDAPSRRYPVHVAWGALDGLGASLREQGLAGAAWVITDTDVGPLLADRALLSLRDAGFEADALALPSGETTKSLDAASRVYDWLVDRRAERGHALVALGGGVIGDLAGFVAATYLRGVPFVQAPTSLLAMVDAAVGGKVAVDHPRGKNLIGAFHQPHAVIEDVSTLKTLPRRALVEGCAEVIKQALILDAAMLAELEVRADDLLHLEPAFTVEIVRRNVEIKGAVVARDERDAGPRAILNYGHTVGHAIEAAAGYRDVLHGEAIAAGMMAAAEIGRRMGVTPPALVDRQRALLERFGLPVRGPRLDPAAVIDALARDKKVSAGTIRWVLLEDAGRAVLRDDVPIDLVREVIQEVLA